jgi:hypothetical protein
VLHSFCCQVCAEHSLQLQPLERVVTVAWQNTQVGPPLEPYQAAAAILTTQVGLLAWGWVGGWCQNAWSALMLVH